MSSRTFQLPDGAGAVAFPADVLNHMYKFAQRRFYCSEAGGQLFSPGPHHAVVHVTHVSGPNSRDVRCRHGVLWNIEQANRDRQVHFSDGRHPVGLWHTHPEPNPSPSGQDERTTRQFLQGFEGSMAGFLLVIIGNKGETPNMAVWLAKDGTHKSWIELNEAKAECSATIEHAQGALPHDFSN